MEPDDINTMLLKTRELFSGNSQWDTPFIITVSISFLLVFAIIYTFIPVLKSLLNEYRLYRAIGKLGKDSLRNIILPDGMGGNIFIDYLVLSADTIIVVTLKRYRGTIFCAENIEQWTQLLGKRSFKFDNPLRQNEADIQSLQHLLPGTAMQGLILFHGLCDFPKGKPERVKSVSEILATSGKCPEKMQPGMLDSWVQIKSLIAKYKSDESFGKSYFKRNVDFNKLLMPAGFTGILFGWLYLRIFF